MLRHPIERAFSHYLMDCRLGFCSENLEDIIANPQKFPQYFQQYLELGNYCPQLKRYIDTFGREQVMIIFYEDFKADAQKVMTSLFSFLRINQQVVDLSIQNPFLAPSNSIISLLYKINWVRKGVKMILPLTLLSSIKVRFFSKKDKPKLLNLTEQKLRDYYKEDVLQLEKLLNIDLTRWKIK